MTTKRLRNATSKGALVRYRTARLLFYIGMVSPLYRRDAVSRLYYAAHEAPAVLLKPFGYERIGHWPAVQRLLGMHYVSKNQMNGQLLRVVGRAYELRLAADYWYETPSWTDVAEAMPYVKQLMELARRVESRLPATP